MIEKEPSGLATVDKNEVSSPPLTTRERIGLVMLASGAVTYFGGGLAAITKIDDPKVIIPLLASSLASMIGGTLMLLPSSGKD